MAKTKTNISTDNISRENIDISNIIPVKKRWFSVKANDRSARWFLFAFDEDDVSRLTGYPCSELRIEPAEWNGEEFVIIRGCRGGN